MSNPKDRAIDKVFENIGFFTAFFTTTTIFYFIYPQIHEVTNWTYLKATLVISIITLLGLWLKQRLSS